MFALAILLGDYSCVALVPGSWFDWNHGALCRMTPTLAQSFHIGSKGSSSSNWKHQALLMQFGIADCGWWVT